MILSAQSIRARGILSPFAERTQDKRTGTSFGLSACGYDIRLDQQVVLYPGTFVLASTLEQFSMPTDVVGVVHDKSSWARKGIAVQNTVIEPGWRGFLTLELTNHGTRKLLLPEGTPIAQVLFHQLDAPTDQPYPEGAKYQDQERGPQEAR